MKIKETIIAAYQKYKPYIRVDMIMYLVMIIFIVTFVLVVSLSR
ncbi:hypothetical protein [Flexithrix dorotheae]|nr:hypothetical protein [Flexithrix dorotheae]